MTTIKVFYRGDDCSIFYAHSSAFSRGIVAKLNGLQTERIK
ncbi:hypothetical protein, partial [Klebsiella pneumoniae]